MRPDPVSLQLSIAVVELGSIAAAAEREHIAAAAISRRIAELEQGLGGPLLLRRARGVEPTAAGLALLGLARRALQAGRTQPGRPAAGSAPAGRPPAGRPRPLKSARLQPSQCAMAGSPSIASQGEAGSAECSVKTDRPRRQE